MPDEDRIGRLTAAYEQVCLNYRAIDEFRTKLLGFLPLATGTGAILLLGNMSDPTKMEAKWLLGPVGAFGAVITLGLFAYELHGIKKCGYLIRTGQQIETAIGVAGAFRSRPHEFVGIIDEPFSASVIYPASLAAWTFFAVAFQTGPPVFASWFILACIIAAAVFVIGFAASQFFVRKMERDLEVGAEYTEEPRLFWRPKPPTAPTTSA